jgi:hypothetical protein
MDIQIDTKSERQKDREREGETFHHLSSNRKRLDMIEGQRKNRQTDIQTYRQTDRQKDRHYWLLPFVE